MLLRATWCIARRGGRRKRRPTGRRRAPHLLVLGEEGRCLVEFVREDLLLYKAAVQVGCRPSPSAVAALRGGGPVGRRADATTGALCGGGTGRRPARRPDHKRAVACMGSASKRARTLLPPVPVAPLTPAPAWPAPPLRCRACMLNVNTTAHKAKQGKTHSPPVGATLPLGQILLFILLHVCHPTERPC